MAQGDAMVLRTGNLYSDYYDFEVDTNADGVADGWTLTDTAGGSTKALYATSPYHGVKSQRITFTTKGGMLAIKLTSNNIQLLGRSDLDSRGHKGSIIAASAYIKNINIGQQVQAYMSVLEMASDGTTVLETHSADNALLTDAWAPYSHSAAITNAATVYYAVVINYSVGGPTTGADVLCDYLDTYETYTFAKNPSMPEAADVDRETKTARLADRTLKSFTYPNSGYKFGGKLSFGMITEAQMLALRSLYLWDQALTFTPNLNKLPASLSVRLGKKFSFNHVSPNLGAGYKGTLEWDEV